MTLDAAKRSNLLREGDTTLKDLGLDVLFQGGLVTAYYDVQGNKRESRRIDDYEAGRMPEGIDKNSLSGWLMRGAIREDDITTTGCFVGNFATLIHGHGASECNPQDDPYGSINRVINHFYDPVNNIGLQLTWPASLASSNGAKSVDWALGTKDAFADPNGVDTSRDNHFSAIDARHAMYAALTGKEPGSEGSDSNPDDEDRRKAWWATTFRSLGDMLHLVQDKAQPQHTKNEPHAGSILEAYIEARANGRNRYHIDGVRVTTLPKLNFSGYDIPRFNRYSDYWSTAKREGGVAAGQGLADYANRAVFTDGTVIGGSAKYALPNRDPLAYRREDLADPLILPQAAKVAFLVSQDPETQIGNRGARMLTESVFTDAFPSPSRYVLTRFNFDDQVDLLLPRAVAYSAGLIDYFFRGKIDMVKDKDQLDGYLIRNLGTEDMKGRFALYYDATDGTRKPAKGTNGVPLVWHTEELQHAPIAPGADLKVTAMFDVQPDAKTPEEYILVFDGDMGEEQAKDGSKGAVVGKVLKAPGSKLYLAGLDTQGRKMYLKADHAGVHLVQGYDVNNQFVDTFERPPLMEVFKGRSVPMGDSAWDKQVAFEDGLRGVRYQVNAFNGMGYLFSLDTKQNWVKKAEQAIGWVARPANEPGIEYEFYSRQDGYVLQYRKCYGIASRSCGDYQRLDMPLEFWNGFHDSRFGGQALSADGTKLCGFPGKNQWSGQTVRSGPCVLNQECTDTWSGGQTGNLMCLNFSFGSGAPTVGKALQVAFPTSSGGGTATFSGSYSSNFSPFYEVASASATNHGGRVIGYFEGKLHHWTTQATLSQTSSVIASVPQRGAFDSSVEWTFPEGNMGATGHCKSFGSARNAFAAGPFGESLMGGKGMKPVRALTPRAQDAIYTQVADICETGEPYVAPVTKFRSVAIDDGDFVIDSSPNGEIFFARSDLSTIVHEPKPYGIKTIGRNQLPANLTRLIGALWL